MYYNRFDRILIVRQTDRQRATAYTALVWRRRAVKTARYRYRNESVHFEQTPISSD